MTSTIVFDPMIPAVLLGVVALLSLAAVVLAVARGLQGWALRGAALMVILAALTGPSVRQEDRAPLSDIVLMLEDVSASQKLGDRAVQTKTAADTLAAQIQARENTELRRIPVKDGIGDAGTQLMTALSDALARAAFFFTPAIIRGIAILSAALNSGSKWWNW